jgi:hypothetical protein
MRERLQRPVLTLDAPVEPRIVDGYSDARSNQLQQGTILFPECADARGLQIDHADQLAAREHRNGELGLHGVESR